MKTSKRRILAFLLTMVLVIGEMNIPFVVDAAEKQEQTETFLSASQSDNDADAEEDGALLGSGSTGRIYVEFTSSPRKSLQEGTYYLNDGSEGSEETYNVAYTDGQLTLKDADLSAIELTGYENLQINLLSENKVAEIRGTWGDDPSTVTFCGTTGSLQVKDISILGVVIDGTKVYVTEYLDTEQDLIIQNNGYLSADSKDFRVIVARNLDIQSGEVSVYSDQNAKTAIDLTGTLTLNGTLRVAAGEAGSEAVSSCAAVGETESKDASTDSVLCYSSAVIYGGTLEVSTSGNLKLLGKAAPVPRCNVEYTVVDACGESQTLTLPPDYEGSLSKYFFNNYNNSKKVTILGTKSENGDDEYNCLYTYLNGKKVKVQEDVYYRNDGLEGTSDGYNLLYREGVLKLKDAKIGSIQIADLMDLTIEVESDSTITAVPDVGAYAICGIEDALIPTNLVIGGGGKLTLEGRIGNQINNLTLDANTVSVNGGVDIDGTLTVNNDAHLSVERADASAVCAKNLEINGGTMSAKAVLDGVPTVAIAKKMLLNGTLVLIGGNKNNTGILNYSSAEIQDGTLEIIGETDTIPLGGPVFTTDKSSYDAVYLVGDSKEEANRVRLPLVYKNDIHQYVRDTYNRTSYLMMRKKAADELEEPYADVEINLNNNEIYLQQNVYYKNDGTVGDENDYNLFLKGNVLKLNDAEFGSLQPITRDPMIIELIGDNLCSSKKYGDDSSSVGRGAGYGIHNLLSENPLSQLTITGTGNLTIKETIGLVGIHTYGVDVSIETTGKVVIDADYAGSAGSAPVVRCKMLTLKNGSFEGKGYLDFGNGDTSIFVIENESVSIDSSSAPAVYNCENAEIKIINSNASFRGNAGALSGSKNLTIQNSTVKTESASGMNCYTTGTLSLDGGSLTCKMTDGMGVPLKAKDIKLESGSILVESGISGTCVTIGNSFVQNGGTFTIKANSEGAMGVSCPYGTVTVNAGKLEVSNKNNPTIQAKEFRMNGGKVSASNDFGLVILAGSLTMTGGEIEVKGSDKATTPVLNVSSSMSVSNAKIKVQNQGTVGGISVAGVFSAKDSDITINSASDGISTYSMNFDHTGLRVETTGENSTAVKISEDATEPKVIMTVCDVILNGVKSALTGGFDWVMNGGKLTAKSSAADYPTIYTTGSATLNGDVLVEGDNASDGSDEDYPSGVMNVADCYVDGGLVEVINHKEAPAIVANTLVLRENAENYPIFGGTSKETAEVAESIEGNPSYVRIGYIPIGEVTITGLEDPAQKQALVTKVTCGGEGVRTKEAKVQWNPDTFDEYYTGTYTASFSVEPEFAYGFNDNTKVKVDGQDVSFTIEEDGTIKITKDFSVKGKLRQYSITYVLNGGSNVAGNPGSYNVETATITLQTPTRTGYTFEGWYAEADFTTKVTEIAKGSTGDKTFYAKWSKDSYNIRYELNGGTNVAGNPGSYAVDTATITLQTPTRTGYTFGGWYAEADFTTKVTEIAKGSTGDKTFYAKWSIVKYTVTYKLNGGKNNANNPSTYDVTSDEIALKNATRTGYTFSGWYTEDGAKGKVSRINRGSTGHIVLYAHWTANKYTIVLNGNGATSGTMAKRTATYDKALKLSSNTYKRTGYTFDGWNTRKNGKGKAYKNKASVKNLSAKAGAKVTLYAQWKPVKYKITYKLNGGKNNSGNPKTYDVTTATIKLKTPTKKGYTFAGWFSDSKFKKKVTQIAKGSTGNMTLYAKWVKK